MTGPTGEDAGAQVARQASLIFSARLVAALSTAVLTVVLARVLGPDDYGKYALALSVAIVAALLADLGIPAALGRYVAEAVNKGQPPEAILNLALRIKVAFALVVFGLLFAGADIVEQVIGVDGLAPLVRIASAAAFFQDLFAALADSYEAMRRAAVTATMALCKAGVEFVSVITLVAIGFGAAGGLAGNALGYAAAVTLGLAIIGPGLLGARHRKSSVGGRQLISYGAHLWVAGIAWVGFDRVDQILLGAFRGATAVAEYEAAWRFAAFLALAGSALGAAVGPRMAGHGGSDELARLLGRSLRAAIVVYLPLAAVTAVVAMPLVSSVLGEDFAAGGVVLTILVPYVALLGVGPVLSNTLDFIGAGRARKWLAIGAFVINAALDIVLIPVLGVLGPAIATNVAVVIYVVGLFAIAAREISIDLPPLVSAGLRSLGAAALGALVAAAFLLLVPISVEVVLVFLSLALGMATAGIVLVWLGELPGPRHLLSVVRGGG